MTVWWYKGFKMEKLKKYIRDHDSLMRVLAVIYNLFGFNSVKGRKGVKIHRGGVFCRRVKIVNGGSNNTLDFGKGCRLYNCTIRLFGENNHVVIDRDCVCRDVDIWISNGGVISIGHNTHFTGKIHIACIEGKRVEIGERCLFSNEIVFRTGDSHSVLNLSGERINPSKDIIVGNHVWVGQQVIVLKGAHIGNETIVGTRALVTGKEFDDNTVIAGSPAKVVKNGVTWNHNLM